MRHTRLFRLATALFGVWFTFTLVQPNGMSGMMMSGTGARMNMAMPGISPPAVAGDLGMSMDNSSMASMSGISRERSIATTAATSSTAQVASTVATSSTEQVASNAATSSTAQVATTAATSATEQVASIPATSSSEQAAEQGGPAKSNTPAECDQHDCCCSALSPISLMPVATFSWLPDHVVNEEAPQSGDQVVHADGQLLLPFANGPPRTVSARS